jgi:hypothetical protein
MTSAQDVPSHAIVARILTYLISMAQPRTTTQVVGLARVTDLELRHGTGIHDPCVCHAGASFVSTRRTAPIVDGVDVTGGVTDGKAVLTDFDLWEGTGDEGPTVLLPAGESEMEASSAAVAECGFEVAEVACAEAVVASVVVIHVVGFGRVKNS